MDGTITLRSSERKTLLECYRRDTRPAVRLRAHIILLLAEGYPWALIAATLFCSTRTIARWKDRFAAGGVEALVEEQRGRPPGGMVWAIDWVVHWVTERTPRDFGFLRSRWCCGTVVILLARFCHLSVSAETVRRWLHRENLVWRRPRPVVGPKDPQREAKLRRLRRLLAHLPSDEVAVFQDEADINTNPKIGCMWMRRGQQAQVETPGNNEKRYLAGSLNWWTGDLIVTEGLPAEGRSSALFVRHLDDLRRHLRCYRRIHVICDNAIFHDPERCRRVREYLARWGHRVALHFLPKYDPSSNPIERVWWHLHEEITRNHTCQTMGELLDLTFAWLEKRTPFEVERGVYTPRRAA
jgi:putative transposase